MGPIISNSRGVTADGFAGAIEQFSVIFSAIWSFIMDNWVFAIFVIVPIVGAIIAWVVSFFNGRK